MKPRLRHSLMVRVGLFMSGFEVRTVDLAEVLHAPASEIMKCRAEYRAMKRNSKLPKE